MQNDYPFLSLLPPIVAILGAFLLRNVYVSLGLGILVGNLVFLNGNILDSFHRTFGEGIIRQIAPEDGKLDHLYVILFTLGTGATVELMKLSRGAEKLMHIIGHWANSRIRGQFTTWLMGFVIFFDDYANTLILGSTARPVTDRLKISREKLAYLVDTTAAPIAGLVVVSTWVGAELSYIDAGFKEAGVKADVFNVFVATIPYRFYAWLALIFAGFIALTGRDFGPMKQAEQNALSANFQDHLHEDSANAKGHGGMHPCMYGISGLFSPHTLRFCAHCIWRHLYNGH